MPTPEVGYCIFLTKEEYDAINAMLREDEYPEGVEGIREFLIDAANEDPSDDEDDRDDSTTEKFRRAFASPQAQEALKTLGPVAAAILKRAARAL